MLITIRERTCVVVGTLAALTSIGVAPAHSSGTTCGAPGNFHAFAQNPAQASLYGVRGTIETNMPALCGSAPTSPSSSSAGLHYLAQYRRPNDSTPTFVGGDPGTSSHQYTVNLRASDDRIHMTRDGLNLLTVDYDVSGKWQNEWRGQWAGETWHLATDVPGTAADPTTINYIQRYESNGDINFVTSLTTNSSSSRYGRSTGAANVGGRRFSFWTDPIVPGGN